MATLSGRNAKVTKSTSTVAELGTWNINVTADAVDTTSFGSTWKKTSIAMTGWEGACAGFIDKTDTSGQIAMETAVFSGNKLTDLRFYIDASTYYHASTGSSGSAGIFITSYSLGQDKAGVGTVEFTFTGVGQLGKT
jgi:hypothetical protein